MTTASDAVEASLAFQRELLEAGRRAFEQSVDGQRQINEAALNAIETQNELQRRSIEHSESFVTASIKAGDRAAPAGAAIPPQFEEALEAFFVSALENHEAVSSSVEDATREGIEQSEAATDAVSDAVDDQFEVLLDAHQTFEKQTTGAIDEFVERSQDVLDEN